MEDRRRRLRRRRGRGVAFGFVLLGRSRYAQAREGDVVSRGASVLLATLGGVLCAAALIVGFIALTKK